MNKVHIAKHGDCVLVAEAGGFETRFREAFELSSSCELIENPAAATIILINQGWKSRNWHDIYELKACEYIRAYAEKLCVISHDSFATVFLPGLYTSLTPNNHWSGWAIPMGYKQEYRSHTLDDNRHNAAGERRWLFSFRGADFTHPVRRKLARIYDEKSPSYSFVVVNKKFHTHNQDDHDKYIGEMLESHFVLAPRGISPSSYRMYEAMQHSRCPVIISDDWRPITGIDWDSCSIRVKERDIGQIEALLRDRVNEAKKLGEQARRVWEENFSDGARERRFLRDLLWLHSNCVFARDRQSLVQLWESRKFHKAHGWTPVQRGIRRLKSALRLA